MSENHYHKSQDSSYFWKKKGGMGCNRKGAHIGADWSGWQSSILDDSGGYRPVYHRTIY